MTGVGFIELNDKKYRIDLMSYRVRDVIDFAPRASVPTGSVVMSDMSLYQPLYQTGWNHGFGFMWYSDAVGYMNTVGSIDTRQNGIAMLFTNKTQSDNDTNPKFGMISYGSSMFSYGSSGLRKYNNGQWSNVSIMKVTSGASSVNGVAASTSLTLSATVEDATNRILVVSLHIKSNVSVSSVTFNGTAMTSLSSLGTGPITAIYYMIAPPVGTFNVVVTTNLATDMYVIATPVYNVDQTTPFGTPVTLNGTGVASSVNTVFAPRTEVLDFITLNSTDLPIPLAGADINTQGAQTDVSGSISIRSTPTVVGQSYIPGPIVNYDDTDSGWTYRGWFTEFQQGAYNSSQHATIITPAFVPGEGIASYTFSGTGVTLYFTANYMNSNDVSIDIDGTTYTPHLDQTAVAYLDYPQQSWTSPTLPSGTHVLTITNNSIGYFCNIDYIAVQTMPLLVSTTSTGWTWTNSQAFGQIAVPVNVCSEQPVNCMLNGGSYLFAFPSGARVMKSQDGITWTTAGQSPGASNFKWAIVHNGYVYAGKYGTNRIHFASQSDLSDLEGTTSDPAAIYLGVFSLPTLGAIVYGANLYVSRADGLWHIPANNVPIRVIDFSSEASASNFNSMAAVNGYLIFPIRDRIINWNGTRTADITPQALSDIYPYVTYGTFKNLLSCNGFLFCTALTNEAPPSENLLCWDGLGWHKLTDLNLFGYSTVSMLAYDPLNNYLWMHMNGNSTTNLTYYIPLSRNSEFPFANFPVGGQHSLLTSKLDVGFRRVIKSMTSLLVEAENLTSTRYIDVWFQLDSSGTWYHWDKVTVTGVTELKSPAGFQTKEFNHIQLRFDFITDSPSQSPILDSYTMRFIMRPDLKRGYNFNVIAASYIEESGQQDERTSSEIESDLWEARSSKSPIKYVDLLGAEHYGYITAVKEQADFIESNENDEYVSAQYAINVNFVET